MLPIVVPVVLVLFALGIIAATVVWAWWHGTLHPSEQERVDLEFARIVRRFDLPTR